MEVNGKYFAMVSPELTEQISVELPNLLQSVDDIIPEMQVPDSSGDRTDRYTNDQVANDIAQKDFELDEMYFQPIEDNN